jgi:Ca2+-binding RTX toxin-like protein
MGDAHGVPNDKDSDYLRVSEHLGFCPGDRHRVRLRCRRADNRGNLHLDPASDSGFTTPLATYTSGAGHDFSLFFVNGSTDGLTGGDTINGSSGADTINGRGGADTLDGKVGGDTYVFNASEIDAGLTVNDTGGSGIDTIRLATGTDFNFTVAAAIAGIEALTFANAPQTATFNSNQLPGNGGAAALLVTGANNSLQTLIVENATNFSATLWTFANWAATDLVKINGTGGANTITGSTLNDIIAGGGGADTLDGGNGSDHYTLDPSDVVPGLTIADSGASGVDTLDLGSGSFNFAG